MVKIVESGKRKRKTDPAKLTTGQVSTFAHISPQSLYIYLKEFSEFFSPSTQTDRPGPPGRSWSEEDLMLVQAIRFFHHQKIPAGRIRELLAHGFRLENEPWTAELISMLISESLAAAADAKKAFQEAGTLKKILADRGRQNTEFKLLWIQVQDLRWELKAYEKGLGMRTETVKYLKIKKRWHGEPPELYPPVDQ